MTSEVDEMLQSHDVGGDVADLILDILTMRMSAEETHERGSAFRAQLAQAGQAHDFDRVWGRALHVRAELDKHELRERTLSALFDSARDLTRLRDPESTLAAIVKRGRDLMRADCAYLMLVDRERGVIRMRVTDGIASPTFADIELKLGDGVAGSVAAQGVPRWTSDYEGDSRFRHASVVDQATRDEGVRSILGAPLAVEGQILGVLLAANRHKREFTPEEVDVYVSLAAHAAVVLENARLFSESRRSIDDLNSVTAALQTTNQAVERAAGAQERLLSVAVQGAGMQDVVDAIHAILGGQVAVADLSGRLLYESAGTQQPELIRLVPEAVRSETLSTVQADIATHVHQTAVGWLTVVPMRARLEALGCLTLLTEREPAPSEQRILKWASLVASLVLLGARSAADIERENRSGLLLELLSTGASERARLMASALEFDLAASYRLAVLTALDEPELANTYRAARKVAAEAGGLAAVHSGRVTMLLPEQSRVMRSLGSRITDLSGVDVTAATARVGGGPSGVPDAHSAAMRCASVVQSLGIPGPTVDLDDLSPYALLIGSLAPEEVRTYLEATLGSIQEYDRAQGSSLEATLVQVYDCHGNVSEAAELLHVHPNTVYQRLARITKLTGLEWRDSDTSVQWQLALGLKRYLDLAPEATSSGVNDR